MSSESAAHNLSLIVSELVTNAVLHARSAVQVVVTFSRHRLRIEVHDEDSTPPSIRRDPGSDGGFGLRIVDTTSDRWGWSPTPTGKFVWAEIRC